MSEESNTIYTTENIRQTIQQEATVYYFQFCKTEKLRSSLGDRLQFSHSAA